MTAKFKVCSEDRYMEMLEVLPPLAWVSKGFLVGEAASHRQCEVTQKYRPTFTAMVNYKGRFFESTSPLTVPEWRALNPATLEIEAQ